MLPIKADEEDKKEESKLNNHFSLAIEKYLSVCRKGNPTKVIRRVSLAIKRLSTLRIDRNNRVDCDQRCIPQRENRQKTPCLRTGGRCGRTTDQGDN